MIHLGKPVSKEVMIDGEIYTARAKARMNVRELLGMHCSVAGRIGLEVCVNKGPGRVSCYGAMLGHF